MTVSGRLEKVVFEGSSINQEQLDEIKARYGISGRASGPSRFPIVLIKPSRYDDEGYVIQWYRSAAPSNSLAVMHGLVQSCRQRKVLGEHVQVEIRSMDEDNTRIRTQQLVRELRDGQGLVILVGVQSSQFSRAMDIALALRVAGVQVCMGGFHVSGSISTLGGVTPDLQEAMNLGVSLFAGEAEESRMDQVLRDAWRGELNPLYNYLNDPPKLEGAPAPMLPAKIVRRTIGKYTSFDAGRGGGLEGSFSTLIHEQGQKSRGRTVDEIEQIVRENLRQGVERFFITDGNFSCNPDWERILDRLIRMREQEGLNIELMAQVDTMCHRLPGFIEKAGRAGVRRVFIGMESIHPARPATAHEERNSVEDYRKMLQEWKKAGAIVFAGYIVGFPGETTESVLHDIRIIQKELAIDLLEPHSVTALPGTEDQRKLHHAGAAIDPDLMEHGSTQPAAMTAEDWTKLYHDTWKEFYTPEHMKTVLRRAAATGVPRESLMLLLLWFHYCIVYEKIDPMQGGYLRRRYRMDRRPTMPKEGRLRFWTRCGSELVYKHWKMGRLYLRFRRFVGQLEGDGNAKSYTDAALAPDSQTDTHELEAILTHLALAR